MLKRILTVSVVVMTIVWAVGLAAFVPVAQAAVVSGDLIKASQTTVYYMGADGYRYVFPDQKTYMTWYPDFSGVKTITDAELAAIPMKPITGNVTYRPGVKMVKITTDPKVYAVGANGTLRWITTADIAVCLYGANWGTLVQDVPDSFFVNYTTGAAINACADFSPAAVTAAATSINFDKGLTGGVIPPLSGGGVTVSVASDSPAGMLVPTGASVDVLHVTLAAGSLGANVSTIKFTSSGLGDSLNIDNVTLYTVSGAKIASAKNVNSDKEVTFSFGAPIAISANSSYTIVVRATFAANGYYVMGVKAATDITTGGTNTGSFPVNGSTMQATNSATVGTVTLAATGTSTTSHDFGEDNVLLAEFDLTANNEDVLWTSAMLKNGGTNDAGIISNLKLIVDGTEVATGTYADGYVTFAINNYLIKDGDTVSVEVRGDLGVGNDGDTVKLYIKDRADFEFIGQDFGFGAQITAATFSQLDAAAEAQIVTLQTGQFSIDFDKVLTPTQDVKPDTQNVVLATLKLKSAGENATITAMADGATGTTQFEVTGNTLQGDELENFELVDVATGGVFQITEDITVDATYNLTLDDELNLLQGIQKSFQLRADVTTLADAADTFIVTLDSGAFTVTGDVSNADITDITPGSITSATTTVKDATLEVTATALTAATIVPNTADVVIYQAQLKAGSADAVKLTSVKVSAVEEDSVVDATNSFVFTDVNISQLDLYLNGVLLKSVSNQIVEATDDTNVATKTASITFNSLATTANANVIPAGTTATLVVKARFTGSFTIPVVTTGDAFTTKIDAIAADVDSRAVLSNDAITETGVDDVNSRAVTLAGTGTISVDMRVVGPMADEDTYILAGTTSETGRSLGELVFKTTNEPVKVTDLTLTNLGTTTNADLKLVKLVDGAGTVKASVTPDATGDAIFENMNLVFIADASTSLFLVVEANGINVDGVPSSTATDGTDAQFEIASVVAEGVNTSNAITVSADDVPGGSPEANEFSEDDSKTTTIVASKLNGVINGLTNGTLTGGTTKIVGEYTFTFDNGANRKTDNTNFDAQLDQLLLTVSKSSAVVLSSFNVYIETSPSVVVAADSTTCAGGVTSCTATWGATVLNDLANVGLVDGTVTLVITANVVTTEAEYVQTSIANLGANFGYAAGETIGVITNMLLPYGQVVGGTLSN